MYTGTVQSQVKLQMLDMKWQKKKDDINHKQNRDNMTQDQIMLQNLQEQAEDVRKGRDTEQIYTKLKSGGTLTAEEIAYLKEHDPEALADYEKAQAEKKAYEKALKNCKTKEEVDRLKMNKLGNFAAEAKSIANNPYIPKDKKLELMNKLNNKVCCIRDAQQEFEKTRAYRKLPQEAEIAEERAKEATAKNDEILAEQMEKSEELDEKKTSVDEMSVEEDSDVVSNEAEREDMKELQMKPSDNDNNEIHRLHTKSEEIKKEIETNQASVDAKNLSFDKINQDIERFILKNGEKKSSFVARV